MQAKQAIAIRLARKRFAAAHVEPVRFGVPFARGALAAVEDIEVRDDAGRPLARQAQPLAFWPDGSVRWALLDLVLTAYGSEQSLSLDVHPAQDALPPAVALRLEERAGGFAIDTGAARFEVALDPFSFTVSFGDGAAAFRSRLRFIGADGAESHPRLDDLRVATRGPLRATLAGEGALGAAPGACRFAARLGFFRSTALVRLDLTLHNPKRARHRGGIWDLGDPGSIFFRAFAVDVAPAAPVDHRVAWRLSDGHGEVGAEAHRLTIDQASSGGEQWRSRNHVEANGEVSLPFRGCRVACGERAESIDRPEPVVAWIGGGARVSAAVPRFWQEFPKRLEAGAEGLRVGLFPERDGVPFELQGGEQKTHTAWLHCGRDDDAGGSTDDLLWVHDPLVALLDPEYVAATRAVAHLVPEERDPHRAYVGRIRGAIEGPDSLFARRETIDEYGWRNFGDTWADHEDEHFAGVHPVISHYNNQYDLAYGLLVHFARSADPRWLELASDLARHVIDVDIYHTRDDRPAYSGGMFWHTDHYQDAGRATHRTYTAGSPAAAERAYGGGPSNEHNYTSGLLLYHYLTGDPAARAAVLELAEWVLRMDDGSLGIRGGIDEGPTGLASRTREDDYHGPGRGAGNSVVALLDAYRVSAERRFLVRAEELIARCIHPRDDPETRHLLDAERRWSYTVFLQALGTYLDLKGELGERDRAYAYARASLARYAEWMAERESPMRRRLAEVEYPTDTWAAQDVRKSCVFDYAARHGPDASKARMTELAELYFREATESAPAASTWSIGPSTRVLAILLANGPQRAAFRLDGPRPEPPVEPEPDFGTPVRFVPQHARVRRRLRTPGGILAALRTALRPSVLRRLLARELW